MDTLGDGLCMLEVQGEKNVATLVRSTCNPPMWMCPLTAPLALLRVPKAASTSLANWVGRLEALHGRWAALRAAYITGGDSAVGELISGRFASRSKAEVKALIERAAGPR